MIIIKVIIVLASAGIGDAAACLAATGVLAPEGFELAVVHQIMSLLTLFMPD